jgi:hypothetical protein
VIAMLGLAGCVKSTLPQPVAPLPDGRYVLAVANVVDQCKKKADSKSWKGLVPTELTLTGERVDLFLDGPPATYARVKRNAHGTLVVPVAELEGLIAMTLSYDVQGNVDGTWIMESASGDCRTTWHPRGHRVPN